MGRDSELYENALVFVKAAGLQNLDPDQKLKLTTSFQTCFGVTDKELLEILSGVTEEQLRAHQTNVVSTKQEAAKYEQELLSLLPRGGFFEQYTIYTQTSEAPLAYHVFCALVGIGCVVGRKVYFDMGHYRLYPPLGVFLLGPSGLRKTSAANIILKIIQSIEITKVYPEKFTPEAVTQSIAEDGQGLLYGPEMSATIGKQKYLEGLIPLLTRLQDCPDEYLTDTISRGKVLLKDVALSLLMCSTPDWFVSNTPADTFGGGFIARNIMVMQFDTPREEDIPTRPSDALREDLVLRLVEVGRNLKGPMEMNRQTRDFHKEWYSHHKEVTKHPEHPLLATYYQRKPDHMKRVAMCLHLVENYNLTLTLKTMEIAINLMDWVEKFIPPMLNQMFRSSMGEQHDFVLTTMKAMGGLVKHSDLVRKVQHRLTAQQLRQVVSSLKEAEQVEEIVNSLQHIYVVRR